VSALAHRWRGLSLFWQIFAPNAAVLIAASVVLIASPATVSSPVAATEAIVIALGVLMLLVVNYIVIRRATRPMRALTDVMRDVDLLLPGQRVNVPSGNADISRVGEVFNRMLDRLENERRQMARRTLLAQEEERRRLARELHDELNQTVAGVMLSLQSVGEQTNGNVGRELLAAQEELRGVSVEVENIVNRLRPETLDDLGLPSALVVLTEQFRGRTGIELERRLHTGLPDLDSEVELVLYRVAQESLTNVAVHSHASRAALALRGDGDSVTLSVTDDGVGIDRVREGNGIRGMRERALLVGATLEIGSAEGGGTEVRLTVPSG
jgi:two-component system, NarL family, sensor histidine kinase UhpB